MADLDEMDDFQARSDRFIEWLKNSGAKISSKIELADLRDRSAGRGVLAIEDIDEDEELFSIPRTTILDVTTSSLPDDLRPDLDDPWLSLILAMVLEYLKGDSSSFKPYFDVLPTTFDTLMYWTDKELDYLTGSAVVNKIGKRSADAAFVENHIPLIRQHEDLFNAKDLTDTCLISLCHRMGSLIMAYAFDLEKSSAPTESNEEWEEDSDSGVILPKGMVPLADMLNADADRNNAKLFYEDDGTVVMKSIKAVKRGEELFNDYGPLPRADVLRRYGYVTDNYAQYDVVEISNILIKEAAAKTCSLSDATFQERLDYLAEHGLDGESWDIARPDSDDGQFSEELRIFLDTISLETASFDKLRKKDTLPKPELSPEALRLLQELIIRRSGMYSSPVDDTNGSNGNLLDVDDQSKRRRKMAAAVIEGEKQVLREAEEAVQGLMNSSTGKRKTDDAESHHEQQEATKKHKR